MHVPGSSSLIINDVITSLERVRSKTSVVGARSGDAPDFILSNIIALYYSLPTHPECSPYLVVGSGCLQDPPL